MTGFGLFAAIIATAAFVVLVYILKNDEEGAGMALLFLIAFGAIAIYESGDSAIERNREEEARKAAAQRARETPRVIREFDGCKVYQFEAAGRERFVTRCPDKTTTSWERKEYCGKGCTRSVPESTETIR